VPFAALMLVLGCTDWCVAPGACKRERHPLRPRPEYAEGGAAWKIAGATALCDREQQRLDD
jgi:hypothetical protein